MPSFPSRPSSAVYRGDRPVHPGAAILTLAGGSLFGVLPAIVYVNAGRHYRRRCSPFLRHATCFGSWIQTRYESQLAAFNGEVRRNGARYLLGLRLLPVFPFFLINLLAGLTTVPPSRSCGPRPSASFPGTAVYVFAGSELSRISSPAQILSARVVLALAALALASVMPALLDRWRAFARQQADNQR